MRLRPTQKLSTKSSSPVLASQGVLSWGGRQSCRTGDSLCVPLLPFHSLQS